MVVQNTEQNVELHHVNNHFIFSQGGIARVEKRQNGNDM